VAVRAINSKGKGSYSNEQRFSIPSIGAISNRTSPLNTLIAPLTVLASDPDGSKLTFTHTGLPVGLSLNSSTGQITGIPTSAGTYNVTIFASDGLATVPRSFAWTVGSGISADTTPPSLTITSHASGLVVTTASVTIRGTASDSGRGGNGVTSVRVNGLAASGGTVTGNNTANWSRTLTLASGSNTITIEAFDGKGNTQMQQITLLYGTTSSSTQPLALTSLTSSRTSPQAAGTSITFTATASGGRSPYQYKWWLFNGTAWVVVRDWSSYSTYTWTPTRAGTSYYIGVWVRDSTMTGDVGTYTRSMPFTISGTSSSPAPLALTSLGANRVSPSPVGTAITFTATASGGRSPYQFKWWLFNGTAWVVMREWSSLATLTWTPREAGNSYQIGVWVRDSTMSGNVGTYNRSMSFAITRTSSTTTSSTATSPLRITSLTSSLSSPQPAGTQVTFVASASGGVPGYMYKWWVFNGTSWIVVRDWNTSNRFTWTALPRGSGYFVAVWVRDSTTTANVGNVYYSVPFATR
jgi:hypothetical protein